MNLIKSMLTILMATGVTCLVASCGAESSASSDSTASDDDTSSSIQTYTLGGTVTGLSGSGLVLQNNGGDDLSIEGDGDFTFATGLESGDSYVVTVLTQPGSPTQTCTVGNDSGAMDDSDISSITVSCETSYLIGGSVSGLSGSGLVLQNNGEDDLSISGDGDFNFDTGVIAGDSYVVTIATQPDSPSQTCSLSNDSGTVATSDISDVAVSCVTDTFTVGGTISGLTGSGLVLQNNAGDDLTISSDGSFTFATALDDESDYAVTVLTQPGSPDQACTVSQGSGTLAGAEVTDITITCATYYSVSVTAAGMLSGSTVTLQNNGADDLAIATDGSFTFSTTIADGGDYAVTVTSQPTDNDQYCNVIDGSGSIDSADVSDITVTCVDGLYNVVDTNQTSCYGSTYGPTVSCSTTGAGQDGAYEGIQPSYTLVDDGEVVLDNNTGLMWQASSDVDGVDGLNNDDKMTQPDAESYCEDLTVGSYSDWRLPTIKELYSIYLFSGEDLSGKTGATTNGTAVDATGVEPFIDSDYFDVGYGDTDDGERAIDGQYASATLNISQTKSGISYDWEDAFFGVNFVDGHLKSYELNTSDINDASYYVRCVRGNTEYGNNDYSDNGDDTVTDNATGLMWQQDDSAAGDFDDAISICEDSTAAGYSDWRLPNVKELQSIVDYTRSPDGTGEPAIDTDYFSTTSFINEAGDTDYPFYWSSSALLNYQGQGNKGAYVSFGRALGYIDEVVDVHGAGAQRSDYKTVDGRDNASVTEFTVDNSCTFGSTAYRKGPQGDIIRVEHNYVRCVRDAD